MNHNVKIAKELVKLAKSLVTASGDIRSETLSEIKKWPAKDVSDEKDLPRKWEVIAISAGTYGVNGCVYSDKEGNLYKITKRCSNLFRII